MRIRLNEEFLKKLPTQCVWEEDGLYYTTIDLVKHIYGVLDLSVDEIVEELIVLQESQQCRIYNFIKHKESYNLETPPMDIIVPEQLTTKLPKECVLFQGEVITKTFYREYDGKNYNDPVVGINYTFERDEAGFVTLKTEEMVWYLGDGTKHPSTKKSSTPLSSKIAQQAEMRLRRKNIVLEAEAKALEYGVGFAIQAIYAKYDREVSRYLAAGSVELSVAIEKDDEFTWLDSPAPNDPKYTIREFLVSFFRIGVVLQ